jgi:hypothetical protein
MERSGLGDQRVVLRTPRARFDEAPAADEELACDVGGRHRVGSSVGEGRLGWARRGAGTMIYRGEERASRGKKKRWPVFINGHQWRPLPPLKERGRGEGKRGEETAAVSGLGTRVAVGALLDGALGWRGPCSAPGLLRGRGKVFGSRRPRCGRAGARAAQSSVGLLGIGLSGRGAGHGAAAAALPFVESTREGATRKKH